jgi:acetyl-CoA acetyltransferase
MMFFPSIGLIVADIDVFEINEAFASQVKYTTLLFN